VELKVTENSIKTNSRRKQLRNYKHELVLKRFRALQSLYDDNCELQFDQNTREAMLLVMNERNRHQGILNKFEFEDTSFGDGSQAHHEIKLIEPPLEKDPICQALGVKFFQFDTNQYFFVLELVNYHKIIEKRVAYAFITKNKQDMTRLLE